MNRVILCLAILLLSVQATHAKGFSERSVKGCYVTSFYGVILPIPANPTFQLPISALFRYCADGKGSGTVGGTQNVAGSCIIEQTGDAEYSVSPDGMGIATATITAATVTEGCAFLDPAINAGDIATFEFRFGINRRGCQEAIGTSLVPLGGQPIPIITQGQVCPQ
jgi:hypothetical protein